MFFRRFLLHAEKDPGYPSVQGMYALHTGIHDTNKRSMILEWVKNESGENILNIYDGNVVDEHGGVNPTLPLTRNKCVLSDV